MMRPALVYPFGFDFSDAVREGTFYHTRNSMCFDGYGGPDLHHPSPSSLHVRFSQFRWLVCHFPREKRAILTFAIFRDPLRLLGFGARALSWLDSSVRIFFYALLLTGTVGEYITYSLS